MLGLRPVQAGVLGLGARGLELRLRLLHVGYRGGAAVIQILRELERSGVGGHRSVEKLLLCIESPQREVIAGELGLHAELERGDIAGGGLLAGSGPGDGIAPTRPNRSISYESRTHGEIILRVRQAREVSR